MKKYLKNTLVLMILFAVTLTSTACSSSQPKTGSGADPNAQPVQVPVQTSADGPKQPAAQTTATTVQANEQEGSKELESLRLYLVNGQRTYYLSVPAYWSGRVEISEDAKGLSVRHRTEQATAKAKNPLLFTIVKYGSTDKWNEESKTTSAPFPYKKLGTIGDTVYAVLPALNVPYDSASPQDLQGYQKISGAINSAMATFKPLNGKDKQKFTGSWKITGTKGEVQAENRETVAQFIGKTLYYHDEFVVQDSTLADRIYYKSEKIATAEFSARYGIPLAQAGITSPNADLVTLFYDSGFKDMNKEPWNSFLVSDSDHLLLIYDRVLFTLERTGKVQNPYEVAGIKDPIAFRQFFLRLQTQIAENDKAGVAQACQYPVTVNLSDKPVSIKNSEELLRRYDQVFTPSVKQAVLAQKQDDLFVNYQGVMVGNGQLWLTAKDKGGFAILSVNP